MELSNSEPGRIGSVLQSLASAAAAPWLRQSAVSAACLSALAFFRSAAAACSFCYWASLTLRTMPSTSLPVAPHLGSATGRSSAGLPLSRGLVRRCGHLVVLGLSCRLSRALGNAIHSPGEAGDSKILGVNGGACCLSDDRGAALFVVP
eukprot:6200315-Pleurochrysis_carterae.AAC.2